MCANVAIYFFHWNKLWFWNSVSLNYKLCIILYSFAVYVHTYRIRNKSIWPEIIWRLGRNSILLWNSHVFFWRHWCGKYPITLDQCFHNSKKDFLEFSCISWNFQNCFIRAIVLFRARNVHCKSEHGVVTVACETVIHVHVSTHNLLKRLHFLEFPGIFVFPQNYLENVLISRTLWNFL